MHLKILQILFMMLSLSGNLLASETYTFRDKNIHMIIKKRKDLDGLDSISVRINALSEIYIPNNPGCFIPDSTRAHEIVFNYISCRSESADRIPKVDDDGFNSKYHLLHKGSAITYTYQLSMGEQVESMSFQIQYISPESIAAEKTKRELVTLKSPDQPDIILLRPEDELRVLTIKKDSFSLVE